MSGINMGSLHLEGSSGGQGYVNLWKSVGDSGSAWYTAHLIISHTVTNLRLRGLTGSGPSSDIAVDAFQKLGLAIDTYLKLCVGECRT